MKKIFYLLTIITGMAACSDSQSDAEKLRAQQFTIDSMKVANQQKETERLAAQKQVIYVERQARANQAANNQNTANTTPAETKKKGWSNTAKGAVIGGVVGAGTGVAVSKNKVKGGIIGGVAGAAAGAGVGAILDKKKKD